LLYAQLFKCQSLCGNLAYAIALSLGCCQRVAVDMLAVAVLETGVMVVDMASFQQ
jgi:hypothetical protein